MAERNITISEDGEYKTLDGLLIQPGDDLFLMDYKANCRSHYGTAEMRGGELMIGVPDVVAYGERITTRAR